MKFSSFILIAALFFSASSAHAQAWLNFDKMISVKSLGTMSDDGEIRIYLKNKRIFFGYCPQTGCENMGAKDGYDPITVYNRAELLAKTRGALLTWSGLFVAGMTGIHTELQVGGLTPGGGSPATAMITHACSLAVIGSTLYHQYREAKCYRTFGEAFGELRSGEAKVMRFSVKVPLKVMREQLSYLLQSPI